MRNAGWMATMALAVAGAATIAAQDAGSQRGGQGQQPGSTRGAEDRQTPNQQTGTVTLTGCVQGGGTSAAAAGKTSGYTMMTSGGGQRSGSATPGAGAGSAGAGQGSQSGSADRAGSTAATQSMTYTLEGGDVAKHVGHQVEVTGRLASSASAGGSTSTVGDTNRSAVGTTGSSASAQTLRVSSIRMLSETCNR